MKLAISFFVALVACGSASAQTRQAMPYPSGSEIRAAGSNAQLRMANDSRVGSVTRVGERQCLVNRKTHRPVCKTRAEWQREADRIARTR